MTHTFKLSRRTARLRAACLFLCAVTVGCDNADRLAPTDEIESGLLEESAATVEDSATLAEDAGGPSFYTAASAPGIPFGAFGLPMSQYSNTSTWTGAIKHLSPGSSAISELAAAKKHGARVVISMAGGRPTFKNANGTFSMTKWKANVTRWKTVNIAPYIADGTIVGHYLIDEPSWGGSWGGKVVSKGELEEMARHSKSIWPTLPTTVRDEPQHLQNFTWRYLDFAWSQYEGPNHGSARGMTVEAWRDKQIADAKRLGLKLMFGINFLDGGSGASKIAGTYNLRTVKTRWQMSAAEVERVGKVLAASSYACGVLSWQWSPIYPTVSHHTSAQTAGIRAFNNRSDVKTALSRVAAVARGRARVSCKR